MIHLPIQVVIHVLYLVAWFSHPTRQLLEGPCPRPGPAGPSRTIPIITNIYGVLMCASLSHERYLNNFIESSPFCVSTRIIPIPQMKKQGTERLSRLPKTTQQTRWSWNSNPNNLASSPAPSHDAILPPSKWRLFPISSKGCNPSGEKWDNKSWCYMPSGRWRDPPRLKRMKIWLRAVRRRWVSCVKKGKSPAKPREGRSWVTTTHLPSTSFLHRSSHAPP